MFHVTQWIKQQESQASALDFLQPLMSHAAIAKCGVGVKQDAKFLQAHCEALQAECALRHLVALRALPANGVLPFTRHA